MLVKSPVAVEAYETLAGLFTKTSFTATERNIVWFTIRSENEYGYCMAAHTAIAMGEKVDGQIIEAVRTNGTLEDARLETLRSFTASVVANRGHVNEDEVAGFLEAGFTKENILEIIVGISHKILSNYTNHIVQEGLVFSGGEEFEAVWVEWKVPSFAFASSKVLKGFGQDATDIIFELTGGKV